MSQSRGYFKLRLASSLAGRQRTQHGAGWCSFLTHASSCVRGSQAFQAAKGRLVWAKIHLMLTEQNKRVESEQAISQVPQLLSVGILTSLVSKEWTHQNRFIIKISTRTAQLFTAPFICISCSRRTGQYTVQQNTHGDRHGPSTTADGTKLSQPLPIPRSQPYCSPKNSPNSRSRRPPSCQRCNSQVVGTVNSDLCFFWETYWRKVIGVFAFRVLNVVFCFHGCVSDRSRSSKVMFRPAAFFVFFFSFIWINERCELFSGMPSSWTYILVSQDSLDELEMNDYWKEVENIASSEVSAGRGDSEADGEAQDEEQQKIPEGRCLRFCSCLCSYHRCGLLSTPSNCFVLNFTTTLKAAITSDSAGRHA